MARRILLPFAGHNPASPKAATGTHRISKAYGQWQNNLHARVTTQHQVGVVKNSYLRVAVKIR